MKLKPYQEQGVNFLMQNRRALLADSMGLGKTAQAICAARDLELANVLVICPAALKLNWRNEIALWNRSRPEINFMVVSYNFCQKEENIAGLIKIKWDCIICDEAHALKSWSSKQTKNIILKLCKATERFWLLTGTPATRSAADYHPLLSVLEPGKHGKYKDFCAKYCYAKPGYGYAGAVQYYGFKNATELQKEVARVSLRRLKREVAKELPKKIYTTLEVETKWTPKTAAEAFFADVERATSGGGVSDNLAEEIHALGLAKVPHAIDFINNCDEPLVVFAWHRDVISAIIEGCNGDVGAIHGDVSVQQKQKLVEMFQAGELDVLILNIAAGGVGITLTRSSHVLFVESCWSPALMLQAEDRVHRIGQDAECVNVYKMMGLGTVDQLIFDTLEKKQIGIDAVMTAE